MTFERMVGPVRDVPYRWIHWSLNPRRYRRRVRPRRGRPAPIAQPALVLRAVPVRAGRTPAQLFAHVARPVRHRRGEWSCAIRLLDGRYESHGVDAEQALVLGEWLVRDLFKQNGFRVVERYRVSRFRVRRSKFAG